MSTGPARRGRPPRLTREQIADAVLAVGFAELTFAAVRERLGVGETTLYRYAPDRDELVRLGLEGAIAGTTWPALDGPWRPVLTAHALTAWHMFEAHPGSATESARGIVPPGVMRLVDVLCTALMREGFTARNAVLACDIVFDLVTDNRRGVEHIDALVPSAGPGRASMHTGWAHPGAEAAAAAAAATEAAAAAKTAVTAAEPTEAASEHPGTHAAGPAERDAIHAAIRASIEMDPLEWFSGKLEVVLDGVERALGPRRAAH